MIVIICLDELTYETPETLCSDFSCPCRLAQSTETMTREEIIEQLAFWFEHKDAFTREELDRIDDLMSALDEYDSEE
jgi:hypothetical protein